MTNKVTLVSRKYRAVYDRLLQEIVVEELGFDAMGADKWETTVKIGNGSPGIFELLKEGQRP